MRLLLIVLFDDFVQCALDKLDRMVYYSSFCKPCVGTMYNMNRELLSIIDTILSRGVLICSSLHTPALHTTETLTGILLRKKEKNYCEEKAQKCYLFTLTLNTYLLINISINLREVRAQLKF